MYAAREDQVHIYKVPANVLKYVFVQKDYDLSVYLYEKGVTLIIIGESKWNF